LATPRPRQAPTPLRAAKTSVLACVPLGALRRAAVPLVVGVE